MRLAWAERGRSRYRGAGAPGPNTAHGTYRGALPPAASTNLRNIQGTSTTASTSEKTSGRDARYVGLGGIHREREDARQEARELEQGR